MNFVSWLIVALVAALFVLMVIRKIKQGGAGSCSCGCESCGCDRAPKPKKVKHACYCGSEEPEHKTESSCCCGAEKPEHKKESCCCGKH